MTRTTSLARAFAYTALAVAALPVSAMAQSTSTSVQYDDLDLSNAADRKKLDRRIAAAGRTACSGVVNTTSRIRSAQAINRCQADVRKQVEAQIAARQPSTSSGS